MKVCKLCGCEAEYHEAEGVWRHKGDPFSNQYIAQSFCDKYGYPIPVISEDEYRLLGEVRAVTDPKTLELAQLQMIVHKHYHGDIRNCVDSVCELARYVIERETPVKPNRTSETDYWCGVCGRLLLQDRQPHCHMCGQRVEWG